MNYTVTVTNSEGTLIGTREVENLPGVIEWFVKQKRTIIPQRETAERGNHLFLVTGIKMPSARVLGDRMPAVGDAFRGSGDVAAALGIVPQSVNTALNRMKNHPEKSKEGSMYINGVFFKVFNI